MRKKVIIAVLSSLICIPPAFAATQADQNTTQTSISHPDFSTIYTQVGKSVVNINVTQEVAPQNPFGSGDPMFEYFFRRMVPNQGQKYKQRGLGSGFILTADGYILTNAHVVNNADSVSIKLADKREFKAKVVGIDMTSDVALLKINAKNLPIVKIGDPEKLKPGNWVVAIGSPFGLENTITQGIISALSRSLPDDSSVPFIQTDVPVNPGNSGGPLINLNGEVVGINSQIYSKSGGYMGISFAIPINYAMQIAKQLKATGKVVHGRLGIAVQPITPELAQSFGLKSTNGALVNGVDKDSGASKAGVQVGDIILKINGKDVNDTAILPQIVSNLGPNKPVNLTIWRNNKIFELKAVTMAANSQIATTQNVSPNKSVQEQIDKLGILVSQLTSPQLAKLGAKIKAGLLVQNATDDAQFAGIYPGDIIIGILNTPINSLSQFINIVNKYKPGQVITFKVLRASAGQYYTIFVPLTINQIKGDNK